MFKEILLSTVVVTALIAPSFASEQSDGSNSKPVHAEPSYVDDLLAEAGKVCNHLETVRFYEAIFADSKHAKFFADCSQSAKSVLMTREALRKEHLNCHALLANNLYKSYQDAAKKVVALQDQLQSDLEVYMEYDGQLEDVLKNCNESNPTLEVILKAYLNIDLDVIRHEGNAVMWRMKSNAQQLKELSDEHFSYVILGQCSNVEISGAVVELENKIKTLTQLLDLRMEELSYITELFNNRFLRDSTVDPLARGASVIASLKDCRSKIEKAAKGLGGLFVDAGVSDDANRMLVDCLMHTTRGELRNRHFQIMLQNQDMCTISEYTGATKFRDNAGNYLPGYKYSVEINRKTLGKFMETEMLISKEYPAYQMLKKQFARYYNCYCIHPEFKVSGTEDIEFYLANIWSVLFNNDQSLVIKSDLVKDLDGKMRFSADRNQLLFLNETKLDEKYFEKKSN